MMIWETGGSGIMGSMLDLESLNWNALTGVGTLALAIATFVVILQNESMQSRGGS